MLSYVIHDMPDLRMQMLRDDEQASAVQRMRAGLAHSADLCQLAPSKFGGGLGIARADMPQIRSDLVPGFLQSLRVAGVSVRADAVPVAKLKPTQKEISARKVLDMAERVQNDDQFSLKVRAPLVVSNDGHILDGHHRWAALAVADPDTSVQVHVVDLPIHALLERAKEAQGVEYRPMEKGFAAMLAPLHKGGRSILTQGTAPLASDVPFLPVQADSVARTLWRKKLPRASSTTRANGLHVEPHGRGGHWVDVSWKHHAEDDTPDPNAAGTLQSARDALLSAGYAVHPCLTGEHGRLMVGRANKGKRRA
uniref:ParB/Sulfiredoxin n=1 Tax=uncultured Caudovirales phage TaxID=2100421 RepID=A0A6J5L2G8_9CAUD|nr:hypothetical protein UFOVP114_70 [uncultured Caudovirales phage]